MRHLLFILLFAPIGLFAQDSTRMETTGPLELEFSHHSISFGDDVQIEVFDDYGNHLRTVYTSKMTVDEFENGRYFLKVGEQAWGVIVHEGRMELM